MLKLVELNLVFYAILVLEKTMLMNKILFSNFNQKTVQNNILLCF